MTGIIKDTGAGRARSKKSLKLPICIWKLQYLGDKSYFKCSVTFWTVVKASLLCWHCGELQEIMLIYNIVTTGHSSYLEMLVIILIYRIKFVQLPCHILNIIFGEHRELLWPWRFWNKQLFEIDSDGEGSRQGLADPNEARIGVNLDWCDERQLTAPGSRGLEGKR